jgi:alkylation response protein AidB-like acyl-CoA dehydrogenase
MAVVLTAEQRELRSVVRAFFAERSAESHVREQMSSPTGLDTAAWKQLGEQLGVQGMAVPEAYGGSGFSHVDLGIVLEEAGGALYTGPLLSTVLAAEAIVAAGDDGASADLLPRLAAEGAVGSIALLEQPGSWGSPRVTARAEQRGDAWYLTGRRQHVPDGAASDLVVTTAQTGDGVAMFVVETGAAGVTVETVPTMDQTRRQAHLIFDGAPARPLGRPGTADAAISRTLSAAAVYLAAEQVGGAARALEMSIEYSRTRHQYGRAIGSFQALKHLCADLATSLESARSAAYAGLEALDGSAADLPLTASAAKVFCSETYTAVTAACVQIHGAIGTTWEHPAHLYFKRAKSSALLFGSPARHRELLATALGLGPRIGDLP